MLLLVDQKQHRVRVGKNDAMWIATKAEALAHVRETAEGILDGGVDPHRGANDIWHSARNGLDLRPLRPLLDAGDALDYLEPSDPRRIQLKPRSSPW